MPGEPYDFGPVNVHAGGVAWHRNRLYVADTKGGLRVFNTDQMFRVSTGGPARSWCGYNAGTRKYCAYGYRYALPQSRAYDNAGARLVYSQAAIDHSAGPPTLLVSEFKRSGTSWVVRWHLNPVTGAITTEEARGQEQFSLLRIQGAVSWRGHHFFSLSNGTKRRGWLAAREVWATRPGLFGRLSIGPEDLGFSAYGGTGASGGWGSTRAGATSTRCGCRASVVRRAFRGSTRTDQAAGKMGERGTTERGGHRPRRAVGKCPTWTIMTSSRCSSTQR